MNEVAASPELAERLQRYSRVVALVAEQLEAMRNGDSERVHQLHTERTLLESELEGPPDPGQPDESREAELHSSDGTEPADGGNEAEPEDLSLALSTDLHRALELLAGHWAARREMEENWNLIQDGAVRSARVVPAPRAAPQRYPEYQKQRSRVDLRF